MTDTTQAEEQVLKTDVLGRVQTPAARREELVDEFERSGLSGKKFAALVGIKYSTFANWVQQRRRKRGDPVAGKVPVPRNKVRWLEAVVERGQNPGAQSQPALVLALPGGARIEIGDLKQVALAAALVRELQGPCGVPPTC
jgi:transposase-like protein